MTIMVVISATTAEGMEKRGQGTGEIHAQLSCCWLGSYFNCL